MRLDPKRRGPEAENLYQGLSQLVVGQEEAVREIVEVYQLHTTGLNAPGRPIGNFLFLGPTGCGKTRLVEATAECLLGDPKAVIKIDCAEFQHSHEIAKLIGSPPGYLGHRETHAMLSQESVDRYMTESVRISFVLFDEIEKASDSLWNLLLGILDKATLTLGDNKKTDFSRTMIFMTGNLGAAEMSAVLQPRMGFQAMPALAKDASGEISEEVSERMGRSATEAARRKFTPEFLNRLDKIVVFNPLGTPELCRIVDLELDAIQDRIANAAERAFEFHVSDDAKQFLLAEGTDIRYGARHLKRTIDRLIVQPLASLIASRQVKAGDMVAIDHEGGSQSMTFSRTSERVMRNAA